MRDENPPLGDDCLEGMFNMTNQYDLLNMTPKSCIVLYYADTNSEAKYLGINFSISLRLLYAHLISTDKLHENIFKECNDVETLFNPRIDNITKANGLFKMTKMFVDMESTIPSTNLDLADYKIIARGVDIGGNLYNGLAIHS